MTITRFLSLKATHQEGLYCLIIWTLPFPPCLGGQGRHVSSYLLSTVKCVPWFSRHERSVAPNDPSPRAGTKLSQYPRAFACALHLYVATPSCSSGHCLSVVALDPAQLRGIPPARTPMYQSLSLRASLKVGLVSLLYTSPSQSFSTAWPHSANHTEGAGNCLLTVQLNWTKPTWVYLRVSPESFYPHGYIQSLCSIYVAGWVWECHLPHRNPVGPFSCKCSKKSEASSHTFHQEQWGLYHPFPALRQVMSCLMKFNTRDLVEFQRQILQAYNQEAPDSISVSPGSHTQPHRGLSWRSLENARAWLLPAEALISLGGSMTWPAILKCFRTTETVLTGGSQASRHIGIPPWTCESSNGWPRPRVSDSAGPRGDG